MAFRDRCRAGLFVAGAFGWSSTAAASGPAPAPPASAAPAPAAGPASAAEAGPASAAEAYDEGVERYRQKRFGEAARAFARADAISPHPVALRQALEASLLADDPALAMALSERVEARPGAEAAALVARARARHAGKAGKFVLRCPPRASCGALVDGDAAALGPPLGGWALAGVHTVHLRVDGRLEPRTVLLGGGQTLELSPVEALPRAPAPGAAPRRDRSPGPAWFWGGAALTGGLGLGAAWSALDTSSRHEWFRRDRAAGVAGPEHADDGRAAQARTNVLAGATVVVGLATAAFGLFAVRWRPRPAPANAAGLRPPDGHAPPGLALSF